jgi:hypothetical protein
MRSCHTSYCNHIGGGCEYTPFTCQSNHVCKCDKYGNNQCVHIGSREAKEACPPLTADMSQDCGIYKLSENGTCVLMVDGKTVCNDQDKETIDSCDYGQCVHVPIDCDDGKTFFYFLTLKKGIDAQRTFSTRSWGCASTNM